MKSLQKNDQKLSYIEYYRLKYDLTREEMDSLLEYSDINELLIREEESDKEMTFIITDEIHSIFFNKRLLKFEIIIILNVIESFFIEDYSNIIFLDNKRILNNIYPHRNIIYYIDDVNLLNKTLLLKKDQYTEFELKIYYDYFNKMLKKYEE